MPGSDISEGSGHSNASSYSSVDIAEGRAVQSDRPVPEDAPTLPSGTEGVYDQRSRQYFAVDGDAIARWSDSQSQWSMQGLGRTARAAVQWVAENRQALTQLARDTFPTVAMGMAPLVGGTGGQVLNYGGNIGQLGTVAHEVYNQYREHQAGAAADWSQRSAIGLRAVSVAANAVSNLGNFDNEAIGNAFNGIGTYAGAMGTGIDVMHHAHQGQRQRQDPGVEMYGLHHNPSLGSGVGQIPAGYNPAVDGSASPSYGSAQGSSTSVQPQPPTTAPAAEFAPPSSSSGRRRHRTDSTAASTSSAAGKQHKKKGPRK